MSWKSGVKTSGDTDFVFNALRFKTKGEAERYVHDLMWKWFAVTETTVAKSSDLVNYKYVDGKVVSLESEK